MWCAASEWLSYVSSEESPTLRTGAVIEGVHLALEAAMVCALGSASLRTKGDTTNRLDDLLLLCQQPDRMKFGHPIDPSQVDALKQLHDDDHRGAFMHTRPAPWSVPIDNRELVLAALTAIEQLLDGCPWDTKPDQEPRFHAALKTIRDNIDLL